MRLFSAILICLIIACSKKEKDNLFKDLENNEEVSIVLSTYHLDSVPKDIGSLVKAKSLMISSDSSIEGEWTVYPPLSALNDMINQPPFKRLPAEITNLRSLKKLSIQGLNLSELPKGFDRLENLEYLDLSFNKLIISSELQKLKKLKKLRIIGLIGNRVDTTEIEKWKKEQPNLKIYGFEQDYKSKI